MRAGDLVFRWFERTAGIHKVIKRQSPYVALAISAIVCAASTITVLFIAHNQPWLGITLKPMPDLDMVWIAEVAPNGPAAHLPSQAALKSINGVQIAPSDLVEEPDQLESYEIHRSVMARQEKLYEAIRSGAVELTIGSTSAARFTVHPRQQRPISSLPIVFWVQIATGLTSALVGVWVWSLRRTEFSAQLLAVAGFGILVMVFPAAIYSTRELAIDRDLFRWLAAIDHFGAFSFGVAIVMLFLVYPFRITPKLIVWLPPLIIGFWWVADTAQFVFSGPPTGFHLPALAMMLLFFPIALLQFQRTKDNPSARAALLSFTLSVLIGTGVFIAVIVAPHVFGMTPVISQGYAFLLFLIMFIGVAVGVARYRLFELESWAFTILFYFGGVLLLLVLDAVLITLVAVDHAPAFGVSLIVVGLLYLPFRDFLARRLIGSKQIDREELFRRVVDTALTRNSAAQLEAWKCIVADVFEPLRISEPSSPAPDTPQLCQEGLTLALPRVENLPPLALSYAYSGRKLFSPRDVRFAGELCTMLSYALSSSRERDQGAQTERTRIARDMHDNIGAQLLSALHSDSIERKDTLIRETISDFRAIINNETGADKDLGEALAELRLETSERLAAASITLDWRYTGDVRTERIAPNIVHCLRSVVREAASNTIRHANASTFSVCIELQHGMLRLTLEDNGRGLDRATRTTGNGFLNMEARLAALRGAFEIDDNRPGLTLRAEIPLAEDH